MVDYTHTHTRSKSQLQEADPLDCVAWNHVLDTDNVLALDFFNQRGRFIRLALAMPVKPLRWCNGDRCPEPSGKMRLSFRPADSPTVGWAHAVCPDLVKYECPPEDKLPGSARCLSWHCIRSPDSNVYVHVWRFRPDLCSLFTVGPRWLQRACLHVQARGGGYWCKLHVALLRDPALHSTVMDRNCVFCFFLPLVSF